MLIDSSKEIQIVYAKTPKPTKDADFLLFSYIVRSEINEILKYHNRLKTMLRIPSFP